MRIFDSTTTLSIDHDTRWLAGETVRRYQAGDPLPSAEEATIWEQDEWQLFSTAEDGDWIKLCGPHAARLAGKRVRVVVEVLDGPA